jgi:Sulfotransferase domain
MGPRIIINSLPKAGTNLVSKLLDLAGLQWNRVCFDSRLILRANPVTRFWRKVSQCRGDEVIVGIGAPVSVPLRFIDKSFAALQPNQFIKAHVGYTTAIVRVAEKHGIVPIVVIRDPRDVIVSQVHYVLSTPTHMLHRAFKEINDRERCFDAAINGGFLRDILLEDIRTRCLSLDVWLKSPRSIVVRFEDLVGDRGGGDEELQVNTVRSVFERAGIKKTEEETRRIAAELHGPGKKTFRKGQIGEAWKEMTPAQLARMDDMLEDIYAQWGYEKAR